MTAPALETEDAGAGTPIVLLHGLTATRRYVLHGSRHLLKRGYRLVSYDARGHGDSDAPADRGAYGYDVLVQDLDRVLTERGLERPVLVGSSMGAHTATAFALEHPERVAALVQITPAYTGAGRRDPDELAHWDGLAAALQNEDIQAFLDVSGTAELPDRWRENVELAIRQRLERHRDLEAVASAVRVVPRSDAWQGLELLRGLDVPTLVVASRDEVDAGHPMSVAEEYARLIPRATVAVEEPGGPPLAWQGSRLSRTIGDFLQETAT